VRVLSAVEYFVPAIPELWYDAGGSFESMRQKMIENAEQLTTRAARRLTLRGLRAEPVAREGEPRAVILAEAEDWNADLIVVGSRGHTGLKRWLWGSVSRSVVGQAACSVEVIRQQPAAA
jgi:nucleotide-binding universal stress UspA family protein